MPYIKQQDRDKYDHWVEALVSELESMNFHPGHANYIIYSLLKKWFTINRNYTTANTIQGVLSCVSKELDRREFSVYEDEAMKRNGDIK